MKKTAVIFPGLGYGADRPLLYYAGKLAKNSGYELMAVHYGELPHVARPAGGKLDIPALEECFRLALERASKQLEQAKASECRDLLIISKSIGTAVGAAWAFSKKIAPRQIIYTPVTKTFEFPLESSIAFHGTADPWIGNDEFNALCQKTSVPVHVFDGANHSLECGDVDKDISYLAVAMRTTAEFILSGAIA
ncbi:MAG: hypothetical protein IJL80_01600 [Treponema sp.]|nr:hypothetical protein [Treponema sp.]